MSKPTPLSIAICSRYFLKIQLLTLLALFCLALPPTAKADGNINSGYKTLNKGLYIWNANAAKKDKKIPFKSGNKTAFKTSWEVLIKDIDDEQHTKLIQFIEDQGINSVYIFGGSVQWDWETHYSQSKIPLEEHMAILVKKLRAHNPNIKIFYSWYANDDVNDLSNYVRAYEMATALIAYNEKYPDGKFDGLQSDQEPNDPAVYADYLAMMELIRDTIAENRSGLIHSATLKPSWLTQEYDGKDGKKPFFHYVLETSEFPTLMDYTTNIGAGEKFETQTKILIDYVKDKFGEDYPINIAIETGTTDAWDELDNVSFHNMIKNDGADKFYSTFIELDKTVTSALKTAGKEDKGMNEEIIKQNGITIHDYSQFYNVLKGEDPYVIPERTASYTSNSCNQEKANCYTTILVHNMDFHIKFFYNKENYNGDDVSITTEPMMTPKDENPSIQRNVPTPGHENDEIEITSDPDHGGLLVYVGNKEICATPQEHLDNGDLASIVLATKKMTDEQLQNFNPETVENGGDYNRFCTWKNVKYAS